MSSNNLTAEEEAKLTHRKSSSFSNSQFREMSSPNFKRHRKTQSDSKKSIINTLKSNSFSHSDNNNNTSTTNRSGRDIEQNSNRISLYVQMNKNVKGFNIERKQTNPSSQLKVTTTSTQQSSNNVDTPVVSSQLNLSRMISLFVLVLLLLSGFLFTPK